MLKKILEKLDDQTLVEYLTWFVLMSERQNSVKVELATLGGEIKFTVNETLATEIIEQALRELQLKEIWALEKQEKEKKHGPNSGNFTRRKGSGKYPKRSK